MNRLFVSLLLSFLVFGYPIIIFAANVDVKQITSGGQREDWSVINKNEIFYLDGTRGGIWSYNASSQQETEQFSQNELPDLFSLAGVDNRYLIYNVFNDTNSYDVRAYDFKKKKIITITDTLGSQWAEGYDNGVLTYMDGGACGKLYYYVLKTSKQKLISDSACGPSRISNNVIVWPYADKIYAWDIRQNSQFIVSENGGAPDIFNSDVIWVSYDGSTSSVHLKNLKKGNEKILSQTNQYTYSWPAVSKRWVIWGKDTVPHTAGIEGYDLRTGETFEIQPQGPHQNGNMSPQLEGNLSVWMAWRTGNGDLYSTYLNP